MRFDTKPFDPVAFGRLPWPYKVLGLLWVALLVVRDLVFATERMYRSTGLYMTRFYLLGWPGRLLGNTGLFPNLYLQHFHQSDDLIPHNHPRWFFSLILRGGYRETILRAEFPDGRSWWMHRERWPLGSNVIPPTRYHYVTLLNESVGAWTLCLVGPTLGRKWGFWAHGKHVDSHTYKRRTSATHNPLRVGAKSTHH